MKKLNLVEILKDVPKGAEFYSTVHGRVSFEWIEHNYSIVVKLTAPMNYEHKFTKYGEYDDIYDGECTLFPSKENRDWEGWKYNALKEGDPVMVSNSDGYGWQLAYYCGGNSASFYKGIDPIKIELIVPIKDFDFDNIESNIHKSVV